MHGLFFQQRDVQKQMFYATAFVAGLIAYTFWEDPDLVEFRYGLIITALLMLLIGSPLLSLVSSALKFDRNIGSTFS
jgi:biotin transporter BioY